MTLRLERHRPRRVDFNVVPSQPDRCPLHVQRHLLFALDMGAALGADHAYVLLCGNADFVALRLYADRARGGVQGDAGVRDGPVVASRASGKQHQALGGEEGCVALGGEVDVGAGVE